ncbi:hypothetical protein D3C80_2217550 [compost metagenome]
MPDARPYPDVGPLQLAFVVFAEPVLVDAYAQAPGQRVDIVETHLGGVIVGILEARLAVNHLSLRFDV